MPVRNVFLALLSGLLLSLGWPTWGFPLLLFFGFVPLLLLEYRIRNSAGKRKSWKVFGLAYLVFFIWNVLKTYWLWFSSEFGAAFAIVVNSFLMAMVFVLYHHFAKRTRFFISSVFLICLWICFEKMHLNWEFSWPWLNLGNGFSEYYHWIQWYEYTGTFGGTLWVWVVNFLIFKSVLLYIKNKTKQILYIASVKTVAIIAIPISISLMMYFNYSEEENPVSILVLQPNIDPYSEKYAISNDSIGSLLFELALPFSQSQAQIILSPETVFADSERIENFSEGPLTQRIRNFIEPTPETHFLSGVSLFSVFDDKKRVTAQTNQFKNGLYYHTYNSAFMLSAKQEMDIYHKSKLVVGVESTPYVGIIKPILGDIMLDLGGTVAMKTTQKERGVFKSSTGNFIAAPVICYESVYGEFVTGYIRNGANLIAIITNDAWWGNTQGHKQHLSFARLRAIETRRSIARSANTGISGFVNQRGDILQTLPYDTAGALKDTINTNNKLTFYVKYGDFIYRISLFILIGVVLIAFTKRRKDVFT